MASKVIKSGKSGNYGIIQRGASLTIPVEVKDETDQPIDLTGLRAEFTVKKVKTDFDRHDDFAYVAKSFLPQDPEHGKFYIMLSSDDTDFEPGKYYFDVELVQLKEDSEEQEYTYGYGMVFRLVTLEFTLDGGPTNRRVNKGMGQWPVGDQITIVALAEGNPIVVIAPTINLDGNVFGHLATLEEIVDNLADRMDKNEEDFVDFSKDIEKIKRVLKNLKQQMDSNQTDFDDTQGDVEEAKEDIKDLFEIDEERQKEIQQHGVILNKLEARISHWIEHIQRAEEFCELVDKAFKLGMWNDLPSHDIILPEPDEGSEEDGEEQEIGD